MFQISQSDWSAGISAEVLEEYAREKPMRIKIPVAYDGVPPRDAGEVG